MGAGWDNREHVLAGGMGLVNSDENQYNKHQLGTLELNPCSCGLDIMKSSPDSPLAPELSP
jgi:hypothetical protein